MDPAERWLQANDADYDTTSQAWQHVKTGEYKTPSQEIPWGNSTDLATLVEAGSGQYVEHAAHRACARCGAAYESVAARHKYCSAKCKLAAHEATRAPRGPRSRAEYMRDYRAAQAEVLYDLGANLPTDSPFATKAA